MASLSQSDRVHEWQDADVGFAERFAGTVYNNSPSPSIVDSTRSVASWQAQSEQSERPKQLHHHVCRSATASPSSLASIGKPPSLIPDDGSSCSESSVATYGVRLVRGADGALMLEQPSPESPTLYTCIFHFLACRFKTTDANDWEVHVLSHFHGNRLPRSVKCTFCDWGFSADDGPTAWSTLMSHIATHHRMGHETTATTGPCFDFLRFLWQKRVIDDAELKELIRTSDLSILRTNPANPTQTTQGPRLDERRRRRQWYPRQKAGTR